MTAFKPTKSSIIEIRKTQTYALHIIGHKPMALTTSQVLLLEIELHANSKGYFSDLLRINVKGSDLMNLRNQFVDDDGRKYLNLPERLTHEFMVE